MQKPQTVLIIGNLVSNNWYQNLVPILPSGGGEGDGGEGDAGGAGGVVDLTIAHIFLEHLKQNNLVFLYKTGIIKSEHI